MGPLLSVLLKVGGLIATVFRFAKGHIRISLYPILVSSRRHDPSTIEADAAEGPRAEGRARRDPMKRSGLAFLAAFASGALMVGASAYAGEEKADPRVGEQVSRICFGRNINNFKTIDGEDDAVLLEKGVNDWYKATLIGACSYRQLKWAMAVAIDSRPAGGCVSPGDVLIFTRSVTGEFSFPDTTRCVIDDIYKWDPDAADDENDASGEDVPIED
jgi:hypothetical protein